MFMKVDTSTNWVDKKKRSFFDTNRKLLNMNTKDFFSNDEQ